MEISKLYELFKKYPKVCTDTRNITEGAIFFALKGDSFNGNEFASAAIEKGCSYAVVDDRNFVTSDRTILVENTLSTLQELALYHRNQFNIPFIGITGTNGKTTTKELINSVLSTKYKTICTKGNLNNHIGVPLTILAVDTSTEIAIIEMGANHIGEIKDLCKLSLPTHGLITNVGKAHLEGFGSFEGVIKTKGELYDSLFLNNGTIFCNSSNEILCGKLSGRNYVSYGIKDENWCKGVATDNSLLLEVKISCNEKSSEFVANTNIIGAYNLENLTAAACIGYFFNVEDQNIKKGLESYKPENNRSQLLKTETNSIIMDAYNANPTSMKASITNFINTHGNNKTIIAGDMLELGQYSADEHHSILQFLKSYNFNDIFLVGPIFSEVAKDSGIKTFLNVDELKTHLTENKIKNSTILIKGSRGIKLENILQLL